MAGRAGTTAPADVLPIDERAFTALCGIGFLAYALLATQPAHEAWAWTASAGAALGVGISVARPGRGAGVVVTALGSTVAALVVLVVGGLAQPEVGVVVDGARSLLDGGTFYVADPDTVDEFRPYLPALFLVGLPEAVLGTRVVGPQVVAGLILVASLALTVRLSRGAGRLAERRTWVRIAAVAALPPVGLAWTASFIDVPQTALTLVAIALLARSRRVLPSAGDGPSRRHRLALSVGLPTAAGLLIGSTIAMKPTGLCAWFVLAVWTFRAHTRQTAIVFTGATLLGAAALLLPVLTNEAGAVVTNVVAFPTNTAAVPTPASTPFPGALIAEAAGTDSPLPYVIWMLVGAGYAAYCWARPPETVLSATRKLAVGWSLAFAFAPTGRIGYLVLPLVVWWVVESTQTAGGDDLQQAGPAQ